MEIKFFELKWIKISRARQLFLLIMRQIKKSYDNNIDILGLFHGRWGAFLTTALFIYFGVLRTFFLDGADRSGKRFAS